MEQLGIFAKYWQPGQVKTRLAETIGAESAAAVAYASLKTLCERFAQVAEQRHLVYWPDEARDAFVELGGAAWRVTAQCAGDLGRRLESYFRAGLANSAASRVVAIGSDSPTLPAEFLSQAFDALRSVELVLGPSGDGGYYLVGATGAVPGIFRGIDWSTERVWPQTLAAVERQGVRHAILPPWYDVDEWPDLQRLHAELQTSAKAGPPWQLLRELVAKIV